MKATSEGRSTGIAGQGDTARGNVDACNCNVQEARRRERVCRGGLESRKVWVGCGAPQKRDRPPGAMSAWACLALVLVAKRHERGKGDGPFRVVVNGGRQWLVQSYRQAALPGGRMMEGQGPR